MPISQDEFSQQVRDALGHLYDYPHLEDHPLALRYWPHVRERGPSRAQRLSRLLLESIEELNPPDDPAKDTSRTRSYLLLVYRYVEERPLPDLLRELGYSRRQFFREQRKAIALLAALLWEKVPQQEDSPTSPPAVTGRDTPPEDIPPSAPAPAQAGSLLDAEAERFLAQREAVDPAEIVQGVLSVISHLARQHDVALESDLAPGLPHIYVSPTLLRQVFLRALSNLITQPGVQSIRIRLHEESPATGDHLGSRVVVTLTAKAHEPAQREAPDLQPVHRLVELLGGQWEGIGGKAGEYGSRFSFPAGQQKVLLVVEDNEAVIRAFRRYLASYSYQVIGATTGDEALWLARRMRPNAVTLDVMIPSQDGWQVLQALKDDPATRPIPVVICSVLEDPDLAFSLGAAGYLRKPVAQADLVATLDRLVGTT